MTPDVRVLGFARLSLLCWLWLLLLFGCLGCVYRGNLSGVGRVRICCLLRRPLAGMGLLTRFVCWGWRVRLGWNLGRTWGWFL